jgi:hypothetical protein
MVSGETFGSRQQYALDLDVNHLVCSLNVCGGIGNVRWLCLAQLSVWL